MLYPNCSEIVWKLKGIAGKKYTDTSTYPNGCIEDMLELLEVAKKRNKLGRVTPEFIDNLGGGGNWNYIEHVYVIGMDFMNGKITKSKAMDLAEKRW